MKRWIQSNHSVFGVFFWTIKNSCRRHTINKSVYRKHYWLEQPRISIRRSHLNSLSQHKLDGCVDISRFYSSSLKNKCVFVSILSVSECYWSGLIGVRQWHNIFRMPLHLSRHLAKKISLVNSYVNHKRSMQNFHFLKLHFSWHYSLIDNEYI